MVLLASGFSDIKVSTGLSTGSIYYHLDRMGSYVTKDSKHYMITEEGLQFLREADPKYSGLILAKKEEQAQPEGFGRSEETVRQARYGGARQYALAGVLVAVLAIAAAGLLTGWQVLAVFASINGGISASMAIGASLLVLLTLGRRTYPIISYRGAIVSVLALGVVLASALVFSGLQFTGAAPAQTYDNSMDELLSSYSMHWQIR